MKRAAGGDSAAFAALVRRHHQRLRAFCSRWCGNGGAGDDVAQECFVEVWRRRALYVPQGKFKEYLFQVAQKGKRQLTFWLSQGFAVLVAGAATAGIVLDDHPRSAAAYVPLYGGAALMSGLGFYVLSIETPTERLLRLYRDDPGVKVRAGVSALPSGVGLGLSGSF
jgi:hypothetical protein